MPFLTQEPWVYDWGVSGCRLPQCLSGLAGSVFGCYLMFCVCLCVLFCMSEEMRPMKLFVLGFRVVAHISMLPVRGAHASVFPHPLFSFCVLIVTFPPGVIRMNLLNLEPVAEPPFLHPPLPVILFFGLRGYVAGVAVLLLPTL